MKTIRMSQFGGPEVLAWTDAPTPQPGPGQILIKVQSAAVNFADVMRRRNDPYPFTTPLPFTPGGEVAGTVEALGAGVTGPAAGTAVFALAGDDGSGGYAQYALANAAQTIAIPPGLDSDAAAGIVVAGSTAILALTETGQLQAGQRVLIEGAGGGVGGYAVQIAKALGAHVIAAAGTPARRDAALAAGADDVVDYTRPGWPEQVRARTSGTGVDLILHISGGDTFTQAVTALAPFGRVVVAGMAGGQPLTLDADTIHGFVYAPALNQSLHTFNVGLHFGLRPAIAGAALHRLLGLLTDGRVKVPLGPRMPLSEAAHAHQLLQDRAATGKIILKPWG